MQVHFLFQPRPAVHSLDLIGKDNEQKDDTFEETDFYPSTFVTHQVETSHVAEPSARWKDFSKPDTEAKMSRLETASLLGNTGISETRQMSPESEETPIPPEPEPHQGTVSHPLAHSAHQRNLLRKLWNTRATQEINQNAAENSFRYPPFPHLPSSEWKQNSDSQELDKPNLFDSDSLAVSQDGRKVRYPRSSDSYQMHSDDGDVTEDKHESDEAREDSYFSNDNKCIDKNCVNSNPLSRASAKTSQSANSKLDDISTEGSRVDPDTAAIENTEILTNATNIAPARDQPTHVRERSRLKVEVVQKNYKNITLA